MAASDTGTAAETPRDLVGAIEAYADYLRVERGLAPTKCASTTALGKRRR